MKIKFRKIILASAIILFATSAKAADVKDTNIMLKRDITVSSDYITLGDVFDGNFDNSDKQIAVAPLPGKRAVYGAYWLYNLARENHIDWRPLSNNVFMNVNRSGKTFGAHEFEMALSDALINNGAGDKLDVVSNIGQTTMVAPSDASTEIKVKNLSFNQRNQSYSAIVDLYVNGESYAKTSVSGRFFAKVEVPIISSNLTRGSIISKNDIDWIEVRESTVARNVLVDDKEIIGMEASRNLRSGNMISSKDLREPVLIEKGALVTISYVTPYLKLTAKGLATENGAKNQVIKITNLQTKKTILAKVIEKDMVSIVSDVNLAMR